MAVATTEVTGHHTAIPGLMLFDLTIIEDERGYFQEKYQRAKLVTVGLPKSFSVVQNSVSFNREVGTTRGFHAEPWDKYISVVTGKVFAAYVDLRKGDSFGKIITTEITPTTAVFLPEGVANSFQTLKPNTYFLYSMNAHWSADNYDKYSFVNLADPQLHVPWPVALDQAIISERDRNHPGLSTITPKEI